MKLSPPLRALTLLAALSLPATAALAAYTQEASTFSAGGGITTSAGYENLGVIGQPGIIGTSTSGTFTANHGFLAVLGDGFTILYPVIVTTPGTLTFSLVAGAAGNLPLGISNTGGSTLSWTVAKNGADPGNIFSFTPATGRNSGTVTVSANAATLTAGTYSNSLTVSGAGIEQTMLVQLDLTVSAPALYTLAVTLKLATPGKGGGTVTSTVPDSRLSCQRTGGVNDVICQADFPAGSTVTLHQTPDSNTTMATWGAPGCGSNPDCQIVLNAPQGTGTDATFPYASMAQVNLVGYESLVQAYGGAGPSDVIKARAVTFSEIGGVVSLIGGKTINLVGGLDAYFNAVAGGYTTIQGRLNIGGTGRVNIKGVKILP